MQKRYTIDTYPARSIQFTAETRCSGIEFIANKETKLNKEQENEFRSLARDIIGSNSSKTTSSGRLNFRQAGRSLSSPSMYTVGGNFDDLTNAWISDPGSPIIVNGQIFSHPGSYKMVLEITTLDNDKTDLTQPLKYEYNIPATQ